MYALTLSQPHASRVANEEKWVENRNWYTPYRGPLAIHAGKGTQYLTRNELRQYPTGGVIAAADLVCCIYLPPFFKSGKVLRKTQKWAVSKLEEAGITLAEFIAHEHTEGPYCLVLRNIRRLPELIPCRGRQGLWTLPASGLNAAEQALKDSYRQLFNE